MPIHRGGPKDGEPIRASDDTLETSKFSSNPAANESYRSNDLSGDMWRYYCDGKTQDLFYVYREKAGADEYEYIGKATLEDFVLGYGIEPNLVAGEHGFEALDRVLDAAFKKNAFKDIPEWLRKARNIS